MNLIMAHAPLIGKILIAVVIGVLLFAGYRAAASASFFQLRSINVGGGARVSEDEIRNVVHRAANRTGVWRADLNAISADLEKLPWVRTAVVSRVLPDGLRVRITERVPRVVARTGAGRLVWVDDDAVMLGALQATDRMPNFFIVGLDEGNGEAARSANQERMRKYLEMTREWDASGLSERVSEVNLSDVRDVRAQLAGDDAEIEVRLGAKDFGKRLKTALDVLDQQRHTPRGALITHLDATLERRVIVGFSSGAQTSSSSAPESSGEAAEIARAETNARKAPAKTQQSEPQHRQKKTEVEARKAKASAQKKQRADKQAATNNDDARTKTRPRRVG